MLSGLPLGLGIVKKYKNGLNASDRANRVFVGRHLPWKVSAYQCPLFENEQSYFMFTRSELEIKTIEELSNLCRRYGLKPIGRGSTQADYCLIAATFFLFI